MKKRLSFKKFTQRNDTVKKLLKLNPTAIVFVNQNKLSIFLLIFFKALMQLPNAEKTVPLKKVHSILTIISL